MEKRVNGLNYKTIKEHGDFYLAEVSNDTKVVGYEVSKYETRKDAERDIAGVTVKYKGGKFFTTNSTFGKRFYDGFFNSKKLAEDFFAKVCLEGEN